jgi:hypothetical protein
MFEEYGAKEEFSLKEIRIQLILFNGIHIVALRSS